LENFFKTGSKRGIQPAHAAKLENQLFTLNRAPTSKAMNLPGWRLHALQGKLDGHWAVQVNGNWRLTFCFKGEDAILVDYQDYH
jgi:proteic killer suppression protein